MDILEFIPYGHKDAITRSELRTKTGYSDRKIRELIEAACTEEHPILNMQDGRGYFRPMEDEMHFVRLYRNQENSRKLKIQNKVTTLDRYLKVRRPKSELEKNQINMFEYMAGGGSG